MHIKRDSDLVKLSKDSITDTIISQLFPIRLKHSQCKTRHKLYGVFCGGQSGKSSVVWPSRRRGTRMSPVVVREVFRLEPPE